MKVGRLIRKVAPFKRSSENSQGSSPTPRTKHGKWKFFEWGSKSGSPLYMTRWKIDFLWFSIRLHKFSRSDDQRAMHDHCWPFMTIILKGGYWDVTPQRIWEWCGPGSIKFRKPSHIHTVVVEEGKPSWSLVITGEYSHRWGFYIRNKEGGIKFLNSQRYFRKFNHH